jgi:hypothetical protein
MKKVVFHSFLMGDVEDPEIYCAQPIYEWQQTDAGQWVMEHCADPTYNFVPDPYTYGHRVVLTGELEEKDATFFTLKWGNVK